MREGVEAEEEGCGAGVFVCYPVPGIFYYGSVTSELPDEIYRVKPFF